MPSPFGYRDDDVVPAAGEVVVEKVARNVCAGRDIVQGELDQPPVGHERGGELHQLRTACLVREATRRALGLSGGGS